MVWFLVLVAGVFCRCPSVCCWSGPTINAQHIVSSLIASTVADMEWRHACRCPAAGLGQSKRGSLCRHQPCMQPGGWSCGGWVVAWWLVCVHARAWSNNQPMRGPQCVQHLGPVSFSRALQPCVARLSCDGCPMMQLACWHAACTESSPPPRVAGSSRGATTACDYTAAPVQQQKGGSS